MKLIATMPVKNEEWCIGLTLRVALEWCDAVVILLHECSDRSPQIVEDIARENPGRVIITRASGEWTEMQHRQCMLEYARAAGATHIAIIDADELLTANLIFEAKLLKTKVWGRTMIVELPGYNLRGGIWRYHKNGIWGNRWFSTAFRDDPALTWAGDKFHHREPQGLNLQPARPFEHGSGGVLHLWGANERRLRAKSALYKLTERVRWPKKSVIEIDQLYSLAIKGRSGYADPAAWGTPETWTYADVPIDWWELYSDWLPHLDVDAAPWQESECRRIIAQHGTEITRGLDLFGVV
jgi:hypothetical protein